MGIEVMIQHFKSGTVILSYLLCGCNTTPKCHTPNYNPLLLKIASKEGSVATGKVKVSDNSGTQALSCVNWDTSGTEA